MLSLLSLLLGLGEARAKPALMMWNLNVDTSWNEVFATRNGQLELLSSLMECDGSVLRHARIYDVKGNLASSSKVQGNVTVGRTSDGQRFSMTSANQLASNSVAGPIDSVRRFTINGQTAVFNDGESLLIQREQHWLKLVRGIRYSDPWTVDDEKRVLIVLRRNENGLFLESIPFSEEGLTRLYIRDSSQRLRVSDSNVDLLLIKDRYLVFVASEKEAGNVTSESLIVVDRRDGSIVFRGPLPRVMGGGDLTAPLANKMGFGGDKLFVGHGSTTILVEGWASLN